MEILWFIALAIIGALVGLSTFLYHLKKGEFEDPEEAKYQMFRDDENA